MSAMPMDFPREERGKMLYLRVMAGHQIIVSFQFFFCSFSLCVRKTVANSPKETFVLRAREGPVQERAQCVCALLVHLYDCGKVDKINSAFTLINSSWQIAGLF